VDNAVEIKAELEQMSKMKEIQEKAALNDQSVFEAFEEIGR
jgi:hypothetical protein